MKQIFFDIDTQIDFVFPGGALYAPGAEAVVPVVAKLNRYAVEHGIPLVSTMCAHQENDPEFAVWGPHCVLGTVGQHKPATTLTGEQAVLPKVAPQIILEKQELDMFSNPLLLPLLQTTAADEYVVYGVVTEACVKYAADGLLKTGKPVKIVEDAIQPFQQADGEQYLTDFQSRGGRIVRSSEILTAV